MSSKKIHNSAVSISSISELEHCMELVQSCGFVVVDKTQYINMVLFCGMNNACGFSAENTDGQTFGKEM